MDLNNVKEVLIVSDSGGKDVNCTMYDLASGTLLESYKEGHSRRNGLDFIGADFLISAFEDRPKIKIWQIGFASNHNLKITTPGVVSALAVSKCGKFCIAGIGPSIYVWEVASGSLDSHLRHHFQDISCVRFSSDGSRFMTGGKDGMVLVYLLNDVLKKQSSPAEVARPHFSWSDHSTEITDIYVGCLGIHSRVATTSLDRTCKIYDLDSGYHLCTINMENPLTCVTMDLCEYFLFLGTDKGDIYRINLFNMADRELQFQDVAEGNAYIGHKKEITSLCVSRSGNKLVSGSKDKQCKIWDIVNFSCVRTQTFSGSVTNVLASRAFPGIRNKDYIPHLCVNPFKREISSTDEDDPEINITSQTLSLFHHGAPDEYFDSRLLNCTAKMPTGIKDNCSVEGLSSINNSIYSFALAEIFANSGFQKEK